MVSESRDSQPSERRGKLDRVRTTENGSLDFPLDQKESRHLCAKGEREKKKCIKRIHFEISLIKGTNQQLLNPVKKRGEAQNGRAGGKKHS